MKADLSQNRMEGLGNYDVHILANGSYEIDWPEGKEGSFNVAGAFGGGTITLFHNRFPGDENKWTQFIDPNDTAENLAITANASYSFEDLPARQIRVTLAGATNPNIIFSLTPPFDTN